MRLILINYSMSPNSLVFSHQRETVFALSPFFESIHVFTTEPHSEPLPANVSVTKVTWKRNAPFSNSYRIYKALVPFLLRNQKSTVFSHMTDVHATLISPITWVLRMRHILWYAHATNSPYLVWSSFFVSNIVSSTVGSCNLKINRKKIKFINQGINEVHFPYRARSFKKLSRFLYYGRLDESKNIHLLLELMVALRESNDIINLNIFGKPANLKSEQYISRLTSSSKASMLSDIVKFKGSVERRDIPKIARDYEVFINLFTGSLDKTLIEATLMGMPVVTWNKEYCSQFGTWSKTPPKETLEFIIEEIDNLKSSSVLEIQTEIFSRRDQALKNHSFDGWIERLSLELLKSSTP